MYKKINKISVILIEFSILLFLISVFSFIIPECLLPQIMIGNYWYSLMYSFLNLFVWYIVYVVTFFKLNFKNIK